MRWVIISKETGLPVGPKTSFPTKGHAEAHCGPNEEAVPANDRGPSGPFSDFLEAPMGLGYMQGRGAS